MSDELFCNLDGRLQAITETPFSSADDAFRLRYGVYETYLYQNGKLEFADLHWERLKHGLEVLNFSFPDYFSEQFFQEMIDGLAKKNNHNERSRIRLQVFTDNVAAPYSPRFLIESFSLDETITQWLEKGIRLGLLEGFHKEITPVSNCKISHNKYFIPARKMMAEQELDDVLLYNTNGRIAESAIANLFWIKNGEVFTPPLSEGCLAGTIRAVLIDCLRRNNIRLTEQVCTGADLAAADEIFLSNGIRKIRWVRELEGRQYKNEMTRQLYDLFLAQQTNRL